MDFCLLQKAWVKNLSDKYCQKLLDRAKKSTKGAIKTASKREIQKTAEATGDLIGNKNADKTTSVLKKLLKNYKTTKQKQIQTEPVQRSYQKKIYLLKKNNKLLMN